MIRIAYHLHVNGDEKGPFWRGRYSPEELVGILYNQDIRVIGITDKNSVQSIKKLKELGFEERLNIYLPVGAEVVTKDGSELLVVFDTFNQLDNVTERMIENGTGLSYLDIAEQTKSRGGKVILQHMFSPVGIGRKRGEELIGKGLADAVEWNLQLEWNKKGKKENEWALKFAREVNLPVIYGCDNYYAEAKAIMVVDSEDPREAFWKLFEGGEYSYEIGRPSLWNRIRQTGNGAVYELPKTLRVLWHYSPFNRILF